MRKVLLLLLLLAASPAWAATTFINSGGDSTFDLLAWTTTSNASIDGTISHTGPKSIKCGTGAVAGQVNKSGVIQDSGTRSSFWVYFPSIPAAQTIFASYGNEGGGTNVWRLRIETDGKLTVLVTTGTATGTTVLSAATWYRISFSYTVSTTTSNEARLRINGASELSLSNITLPSTGSSQFSVRTNTAAAIAYFDDIYIDDSSALTDPGDVRVTAKRPVSNGTKVEFTAEVGTGPAPNGTGSGHAVNVSERPYNDVYGWSINNVSGAVKTEEYTIESASTGDVNISGLTIVDYLGWIVANSGAPVTGSIMLGGSSSGTVGLDVTKVYFSKVAGSTTYPAGGTDIGLLTDTSTNVSNLYEAGVVIAYINGAAATGCSGAMLRGFAGC
jgi:hypothetical protein